MPTGSVESRLRELETQLFAHEESAARRRRRLRRVVRAGTLALALLAAPVVLASDRFTDVPTASTFHDQINLLAEAGITHGCNPPANTRYCPSDPVRRDQMAAFLIRSAGRADVEKFYYPATTPGAAFASVEVKAEGDALVIAHVSAWINILPGATPDFPCNGHVYLALNGLDLIETSGVLPAGELEPPSDDTIETGAAQTAWVVAAGNHTVNLVYAGPETGSCDFTVGGGSLTAMVVPFGGRGGSPVVQPMPPSGGPATDGTILTRD